MASLFFNYSNYLTLSLGISVLLHSPFQGSSALQLHIHRQHRLQLERSAFLAQFSEDQDGVSSNEGSARVALRVIRPEGEAREAARLCGGPHQPMAHPGVVERRRVALRAGREVCGGGDEEAVHAGQGDAVAATGLVPAPQALQCALGACFHQALGPQPLATGLVDSNAHAATTLLTPTFASPVSKI